MTQIFRSRVAAQRDLPCFTFLRDGETEAVSWTYGDLEDRARSVAARLQSLGDVAGERALLLYPSGLDFIAALFGCFLAGVVAVPAYPPRRAAPGRGHAVDERLRILVRDAEPRIVLTDAATAAKRESLAVRVPGLAGTAWLATDAGEGPAAADWREPRLDSDALAFLQYTSGSTSDPKGVMVTHASLLANEKAIRRAFGTSPRSVVVGWLPLYHDMGLVGNVLQTVYAGARCVLMSPQAFLQQPLRWLATISRYGATISGGPDFAYDLCVRRITEEQKRDLDLSSWAVAFNGAEPVREETLRRFAAAFSSCGFRRRAFFPCYGLAEATLFVSGGPRRNGPRVESYAAAELAAGRAVHAPADGGRPLVGCGRVPAGRVVVVDPASRRACPAGRVGEIWVSGPNVARGYWRKDRETARAFAARRADSPDDGSFLRTGDLGFLADGELFVTGRRKDLIILRGRNHYPQDIERTAEGAHPDLRPGCGAAFAVETEGGERLVLVHEVERRGRRGREETGDLREVAGAVARAVAEVHEVPLHALALIEPGTIPKTSSGKIRRQACRAAYLAGRLALAGEWRPDGAEAAGRLPRTDTEERLAAIWGEVFAREVGIDEQFLALGGDSLQAAQILARLRDDLGVELDFEDLLAASSVAALARRLTATAAALPAGVPPLVPVPRDRELVLSFAQRRLWFLQRFSPESPVYNIAAAARLEGGPPRVAALAAALAEIERRHEVLRTVYETGETEPSQRILPPSSRPLPVVDLAGLPAPARRCEAGRLAAAAGRAAFDLACGPVFRRLLVREAEDSHTLVLVVHHIAADGGSLRILLRELATLYRSFSLRRPSPLREPVLQYADYAVWQRAWLQGEVLSELVAEWRQRLAGELPVLDLPVDRPRPPVLTHRGGLLRAALPVDLAGALGSLAHRRSATPFMVLLAGFLVLLHRYTGQEDLLVGLPVDGRDRLELEELAGLFPNTLVLRAAVYGGQAFLDLLAQVRAAALAAFAGRQLPFDVLVDELHADRDPSRMPIVQTLFVGQNAPLRGLEVAGLRLTPEEIDTGAAQFDLSVSVAPVERGWLTSWSYNTDLFDRVRVERMARHFAALLHSLAFRSEASVADLELLAPAEHQQLVTELNDTAASPVPEICLHQLFEAQAARTPAATAVVGPDGAMTYAELDARAESLARHLRVLGIGPERLAGVLLDRTAEMVAALLAVLKSGGAYVPLDPGYPRQRLAFMLADSRAAALVTRRETLARVGELPAGPPRLLVDEVAGDAPPAPPAPSAPRAMPAGAGHLAYLIYTSGSTGTPKGVALEHRSAVAFVRWALAQFSAAELAAVVAATSISFDLSVFELFVPLAAGGTVVIAANALEPPATKRPAPTLINTVPSALAELVRAGALPPSVGTVNLAGEPLTRALADAVHELGTVRRLFNLYGPSETTTYSTFSAVPAGGGTPAVGRPITGTRVYLLDAGLEPVPFGVSGSLYLGGAGLARGYFGRPDLTAERFLPDPFGGLRGEPGARLYRTGDLARFRSDGELDFLGRADGQVKVRGFRIEPGEIEAALVRLPVIREAAVGAVRRDDRGEERYLVAWVVGREELDVVELRAALGDVLPAYMLPAVVVTLDALPRTPGGKVDRRALLQAKPVRVEERGYVAPGNEVEESLAAIWSEVLGVEQVGVEDDFFALGGDSILAVRVASRAQRLGLTIHPQQLFALRTIAALAAVERRPEAGRAPRPGSEGAGSAPAILARLTAQGPVEDVYALSPMQEGMLAKALLRPPADPYFNQFAFLLDEHVDIEGFRQALDVMVERHPILRTAFAWEGLDRPLQVVRAGVRLEWTVQDWRDLTAADAAARLTEWLDEDHARGIVLSAAPLMRCATMRLAAGSYFVWSLHHLLLDAWSIFLLMRELGELYAAAGRGSGTPPAVALPYRSFIAWLEQQDRAASETFWRRTFEGFEGSAAIGLGRPPQQSAAAERRLEERQLVFTSTVALQRLARREGLTLSTLIQGAWARLLAAYCGREDVVFGVVTAGRPADLPGSESMIGLFINTLPARVRAAAGSPLLPWLRELQQSQAEARRYEFASLVQVQRWSGVQPGLPLFESILSVQNQALAKPLQDVHAAMTGVHLLYARQGSDYPLSVAVTEDAALTIVIQHDAGRFDAAAVERMLGHLATLLEGMTVHPELRLGELPLMSAEERRQVLLEWNGAAAPRWDGSVPELLAGLARQRPASVAVVAGGQALSHGELQRRAGLLAGHLRSLGVGPEARVGLCVERTAELAVGLLGIWQAGGAYVPLDAALPETRLRSVLAGAAIDIVVTLEPLACRLPRGRERLVLLDREEWMEGVAAGWPAMAPESLAYVIYTSGSTGEPKGVAISHGALASFAAEAASRFRLEAADRILQFSPLSFNVVLEELLPVWLAGGAVVLAEGVDHLGPAELGELIAGRQVTGLELPASYWHQWVDELELAAARPPAGLRFLILGCDKPHPRRVASWRRWDVPLINVFGLTETTITSSSYRTDEGPAERDDLPIGRPLGNSRVYLLDGRGEPVPVGVAGELHIGGPGLGRGYLGRPELTAERFVPDHISGEPGARLYWTGDLARFQADAMLEFLGRRDHQVKVRGFRIELGEVEAALCRHPAVGDAAAVAHQHGAEGARLAAYVVPSAASSQPPSPRQLREFLSGSLPDYMMPAALTIVAELPRTATGKVDRRALPVPEWGRMEATDHVEPRTAREELLARIWADVLGVERVGTEENFFELGGDSILSIQVVSRAQRAGLKLTPWDVFQHPTVAALAAVAQELALRQESKPKPAAGGVPMTPVQRWFFAHLPERPGHWNLPVLLTVRRRLDAAALERALATLVAHHDALRLRYRRDGEVWLQLLGAAGGAWPFVECDLSGLPEAAVRAELRRTGEMAQASLDLTGGLLARAVLYRSRSLGDRLLLAVHHLIVDGVSWRILLDDLESALEQATAGRPVMLAAETTSFQAWAHGLLTAARSEAVQAELTYWAAAERRQVEALPLDGPGGANTESSVGIVERILAPSSTRALLRDVPAVYHTEIQDVLLAALARVFAAWTGHPRLLVDLEGHGREEGMVPGADLTRTVGWFTTVYPVLLDLSAVTGEGEAIKAVKERLRAVPRRGIGYGLLRHLDGSAAADLPSGAVLFNYFGQLDRAVAGDRLFGLAAEECGAAIDGRTPRDHVFEINCSATDGGLRVRWHYSENLHRRDTVEALAERYLASLQELIAHCLSPEAGGHTPSDFPLAGLGQEGLDLLALRLGRDAVEDVYRLSPMQQGMLFHALAEPELGLYVGRMDLELHGALQTPAFRSAWQAVTDRHPALRTAFFWEGLDEPLQVVHRRAPMAWEELDWTGLPPHEQELRFEALLHSRDGFGFDLRRSPLTRLTLVRMAVESCRLLWDHHQAILDGWSLPVIWQEVMQLYCGFLESREARLPQVRPYRDYIAWLARQDLAAAREFWQRELAGFEEPARVAVSLGAGADQAAATRGTLQVELPAAVTQELAAFARHHGLTLNTLTVGAWSLLLSRYEDRDDVLFGVTVSGRPGDLEGVDSIVGLFINTLPMRVKTPPGEGLVPWLATLQERQVEMRRYEHTPLAQIQAWSEVGRGRPLFESFLVFQNYPIGAGAEAAAGLRLGDIREIEWANYPLAVMAIPREVLQLQIGYDGSRFGREAAGKMLEHLRTLLGEMAGNASASLGDLQMLSPAERRQLLVEWNGSSMPWRGGAVPELLADVARRRPDATALVAGEEVLSHGELQRRSCLLAAHLRSLGIGPEARVGLAVERTAELAIGLLGIWRAGGAYVPLDAALPASRLRSMLEGAGIRVVVGTPPRRLPLDGERVVWLDEDGWLEHRRSEAEAELPVEALAYVMHTSGSTGEPKRVAVSHGALASFAVEAAGRFGLGPADRLLQFSPLSFNVVLEEMLPVWLAGGAVVLEREVGRLAPGELDDLIAAREVTGLELPAAYWHEWADALESAGRPPAASLRFVILGCEKPHPHRVSSWLRWGVPLINVFGLTETTITSSLYRTDQGPSDRVELPIGRPLGNSRVYVLDGRGGPAPVGVAGELYIGGQAVGRGYLGDAGMTAERFLPDALSGEAGARLYRTRDLARFGADGMLEFLGRRDHQVKVRGFRVELGEIEAALRRHRGVGEAVAVAHPDAAAGTRLAVYVVPVAGRTEPLSGPELRRFLTTVLPEYMVPAALRILPSLPLTATGKVNRSALPPPDWGWRGDDDYVAPRTGREAVLAAIWGEVLGVERVGVEDDFFELGGDSILSIQVVSRAHRAGLRLSPRQLFQHPTVARLAAVAEEGTASGLAEQGPVSGEAPLTPIQRWFFQRLPERPEHWNLSPFLAIRQPLAARPLTEALAALVEHHDALRLRFRRTAEGWRQEHGNDERGWPLLEVDLTGLPAAISAGELPRTGGQAQASLDLAAGPLVRAVLYRLDAATGDRLLLAAHHLVVDGVAWRILLEDLETAHAQAQAGRPVSLPPKTTSFKCWAEGLQRYTQTGEARAELAGWLARRDEAPVPVDHPGGANTEGSIEAVAVALGPALTRSLLRDVPGAYRTETQDVLLTALAQTFAGWTGRTRLQVDLEGHGREEEVVPGADLTRTVGWLSILYPVLLDLEGAAGPGDALKAVKEQLRSVPRRGIGYGVLRYLTAEGGESLQRLPQSDVLFEYLGRLDRALPESTPFSLAPESAGPDVSPAARRQHLLSVWGGVVEDELQIRWTYSRNLYERATVEGLAQRFLASLRELIAHCTAPQAGGFTPSDFPLAGLDQASLDRLAASVGCTHVQDVYALSPMQQGMLFHTLFDSAPGVYASDLNLEIAGRLDPRAVEEAWRRVLSRHAALRTGFYWEGLDETVQVVLRDVRLAVEHLDWSACSAAEREERWRSRLAESRQRAFALHEAPLMSITLIRLAEDLHRLSWRYHMILFDGWSQALVVQDFFQVYGALLAGDETRREPPRGSYRDFIAWLQRQDPASSRGFWQEYLAGITAPTALGPPAGAAGRGAPGHGNAVQRVAEETTTALLVVARRHRVTFNTLVQAAWACLLSRYSGAADVVFGSTVAGRPPDLEAVESIVGLFINTLPVRTRVPEAGTLLAWVAELQEEQAELRQYEHVPLSQIQSWSELPAGRSLFESILVFQNFPLESLATGRDAGLLVRPLEAVEQGNYPLALSVLPRQWLELHVSYDGGRFDAVSIARLLGHFGHLLAELAAGLDRPVAGLSLLSAAERHQAVVGWNDTEKVHGRPECLHELFAAQAERAPDRVAAVFEGRHLTYGELARQSGRLALQLRSVGVGPEVVVAVSLPRSLDLMVAVLAVLRAGGAYLPLDPDYPMERLGTMMADARAGVLLGPADRPAARAAGPEISSLPVAPEAWPATAPAAAGTPDGGAVADNLAYVIFTSGSSGRPKGAMIPHRAIANRILWLLDRYRFTPADKILQKTSFSFDASVWELFAPLFAGACVVLARPGGQREPGYLARTLVDEGITILQMVPTQLKTLLDEPGFRQAVSLRRLFCGGEALEAELAARLHASLPVRLHNTYGPTEAAIDVTAWDWPDDSPAAPAGAIVPIGRPIDNVRIHLAGRDLMPVPPGVAGELYIAGVAPGRGYVHQPGLTAERFVPDAWSGVPGARAYRTGDLARHLRAGELEYLGRLDEQVKVRGFRIEPEEIEAVLESHPAVRQAVVVARGAGTGERRLIAFLVAGETPPGIGELRGYLGERLPEHMVPSAFVFLAALPLTASGKLDRLALPELAAAPTLETEFVPPRTPVEAALAKVWRQVLGIERAGIHDNFFELGGDSILSVQIVSRMRQHGVQFTPRHVFEHPTIARLAAVAAAPSAPAPQPEVMAGEVPLTPIQRWFFERLPEQPAHWNLPVLLALRRPMAPPLLGRTLAELVHHHDALRLRFHAEGGTWHQVYGEDGRGWPLTVIDLSEVPADRSTAALARAGGEVQADLDPWRGPLLRAALLRLPAGQGERLLLVAHHLVVDGVSWRILLEDLQEAYRQLAAQREVSLPPKTTSLRRWAEGLLAYAASEELPRELDYWAGRAREHVAGVPVDHAGGANTEGSAAAVRVTLEPSLTRALLRQAPAAYRTEVQELLLAALALTFEGWSGQRRLLVDLEGHGREEEVVPGADLTRTVGWLTSLYPVLLDVSGAAGPAAVIKTVKEQMRAVPRRGIGYGALRYLLPGSKAEQRLRALPAAQVLFEYMGRLDRALEESAPFALAMESAGPATDPRALRRHLLAVWSGVVGEELEISWSYSRNLHERSTIETLAYRHLANLRQLIEHCLSPEAGGFTPADFPLARLEQPSLDRLVARFGEAQIEDIYPLTPVQHGMLFHTLFDPGSGVYVGQLVLDLSGALDDTALERAWQWIVARHAALRTAFVWEGLDDPLQVVCRSLTLPLERQDWQALSGDEREARWQAHLSLDRQRGFDLASAPLMRLTLIRLGEDAYRLLWSFPMILLDGWSLPLILSELFRCYADLRHGVQPAPGGQQGTFRDFIAWLQSRNPQAARTFWERYLAGFTAATPLALDQPDVAAATAPPGHAMRRHRTTEAVALSLQASARRQRLTVNTLAQAAWALQIGRYSGKDDVVFGATVAGRSAEIPGIELMVGLFINTLPVRVRVPAREPLSAWLSRLQEEQVELRQHEFVPLAEIKAWAGLPAGQDLFDSVLVFENHPLESARPGPASGFEVHEADMAEQTNYAITLSIVPGDRLTLDFGYDPRRFDAVTIDRMAGHFATLLAQIGAGPARSAGDLSPMTAAERHQLITEWQDTSRAPEAPVGVHELFQAQVRRTPERPALIVGDLQLTFRELNLRAERLARHLMAMGVAPESRVALFLRRDVSLLPAVLAVLKAGAAYVPIDPDYPASRISFVIEDAGVAAAVTDDTLAKWLPSSLPALRAEAGGDPCQAHAVRAPRAVGAESAAYVIYTSGSTGKPKGVVVTHGNVGNFFAGMGSLLGPGPGVWLAATSISFDISVLELLWPLTRGFTVLLAEARPDERASLAAAVASHGVSCFQCTPSRAQMLLLEPADAAALGRLERLLVGGEALSPALADALLAAGAPELLNMYGPTETTVWSAVHRVVQGAARIPIGRPIANTDLYLLDHDFRPAPLGVPAELYIGGDGVARGYFRRPELTAGRFVPDGLSGRAGARLYRTGDVARWLPHGELEFLGRVDQQVKVRGHRIELGEIEAVLASHPEVREAVVVARSEAMGGSRLLAYLVARSAVAPAAAELRAFLGERLPQSMVPSDFFVLPALPLTPNGKVDRRALPDPGGVASRPAAGSVGPRTPLEEELADVWRQVLGLARVGVEDDFFDLGGHSLKAMQLIARLRTRLAVDLSLRELLQAPTIAEVAVLVTQKRARQMQSEEVLRILQELEAMSRDGAALPSSSQGARVAAEAADRSPD